MALAQPRPACFVAFCNTTRNEMTWIKGHAEFAALVITILVIMVSISATYGVSQHQINRHEVDIQSIKEDVDVNEDILIEIRNDVKWLRLKLANGR